MFKRTKIIATLGPASESREVIYGLIEEGVNLFRFNLKHNERSWHKDKINLVREIAEDLNKKVGVVLDLQGPDIRIGNVSNGKVELISEKEIYFESKITGEDSIELAPNILRVLDVGQEVVIDDGNHRLEVIEKISPTKVKAQVIQGKTLTPKKSIFFPDLELDIPALSKKDEEDVKLASEVDAEYLALSFVRNRNDIVLLRKLVSKLQGKSKIIAKIETLKAVKNISEILEEADAIMVARGDLGVEINLEAVPSVQKKLINMSIKQGKPVIVATQILKSMVENPIPTRAEISDIANASYELTDAVMLSEESAVGKYPEKVVHFMSRTLRYNEMTNVSVDTVTLHAKSQIEAIVLAANNLQKYLKEGNNNPVAFIVLTESGKTATLFSATRPELPILAFTQSEYVARSLSLSWGVESFTFTFETTVDGSVKEIVNHLVKSRIIKKGDSVIVVSGQNIGVAGQTDSLRIITV